MTSVPFTFDVAVFDETRGKNEHFGEVEFRFTTKSARGLERAAQSGIAWLLARGQNVEARVLLTCYALSHSHPKMTEDKATALIQAFIEKGGDVNVLSDALMKALRVSGVYGRPEGETAEGAGEANPQTESPAA